MNEVTNLLGLKNKSLGEKEKTARDVLTVERISASFAEETAIFLRAHEKMIKIKELGHLGFTKSFFCREVVNDRSLAARVYEAYLIYARSWKSGNPQRFAEKMRFYYINFYNYSPLFFDDIARNLDEELTRREGKENGRRGR